LYTYCTITITGPSYRKCFQNATWDRAVNVSLCRNAELTELSDRTNQLQNVLNNNMNETVRDITEVFNISKVETVSGELAMITDSSRGSISPNDLSSTIEIIDTITM